MKSVLEGKLQSGLDSTKFKRKARETKVTHSETKVRPLAQETRKQHNHDRKMDAMALQKRKVSAFVPSSNPRSQRQSSFTTLETGVFFASIATGMSPEKQGYEARLQNLNL